MRETHHVAEHAPLDNRLYPLVFKGVCYAMAWKRDEALAMMLLRMHSPSWRTH